MDLLTAAVAVAYSFPAVAAGFEAAGWLLARRRRARLGRRRPPALLIYQVPTVGNVETANRAFRVVKGYRLPVPVETWAVVEEGDPNVYAWDPDGRHVSRYEADRVVVVPRGFQSEDLYKARALEYARRFRRRLVEEGKLPPDYLLVQGDDDSVPSREFLMEALEVDADVVLGAIVPVGGGWAGAVADFERPVACHMWCLLFTNLGRPVWGHGEAVAVSAAVDMAVGYEVSDVAPHARGVKLWASEDMFYLHKAALRGFKMYATPAPVYVTPPLSLGDLVRQRRRWTWGHIHVFRHRLLPRGSLARLAFAWTVGYAVFAMSTAGAILHLLGLARLPWWFASTLALWLASRGWAMRKMGLRAAAGTALSHATAALNFFAAVAALAMGNPKRFEVIRKA